mmetsp:Transcript_13623/g.38998  ORF Transcript_13623/g.38998 Transcript_13623/m.38998 type:complete len:189 (-) Transcript_13623:240-806(-)
MTRPSIQELLIVGNKRRGARGIYIGRASPRQRGSPLGNPFKMKSEADRDTVVAKFKAWLKQEMQDENGKARMEIERIARLVKEVKRNRKADDDETTEVEKSVEHGDIATSKQPNRNGGRKCDRNVDRHAVACTQTKIAKPICLVCWCAPKRCHGDVIKEFVEEMIAEEEESHIDHADDQGIILATSKA